MSPIDDDDTEAPAAGFPEPPVFSRSAEVMAASLESRLLDVSVERPQLRGIELRRKAGAGGMGDIYEGWDTTRGRRVAVKLLQATNTAGRLRFEREAELLAKISHPRVVGYLGGGYDDSGAPYLVMEWLDGEDLSARLGRGPLTVAEGLRVALRAAEGLGAAHESSIVHRDIKPSNIFLVGGDVDATKVIDFGVARPIEPTNPLTATGVMVGTPAYMAPEQVRSSRALSARVDVFALGAVLYRSLCGVPPFRGDGAAEVLAAILSDRPAPVRAFRDDVPPEVENLVFRMLEKEPADRFHDGNAVAAALAPLVSEAVGAARPTAISSAEVSHRMLLRAGCLAPEQVAAVEAALKGLGCRTHRSADGDLLAAIPGRDPKERLQRGVACAARVRDAAPAGRVALWSDATPEDGQLDLAAVTAPDLRSLGPLIQLGPVVGELLRERPGVKITAWGAALDPAAAKHHEIRTPPEASLVGRARETSSLRGGFLEVFEDGVGRTILVLGEAGLGKSLLLARAVDSITEEYGDELTAAVAYCDSVRSSIALGLAGDLVRATHGLDRRAAASAQYTRLGEELDAITTLPDKKHTHAFLAEMLSIGPVNADSEALKAARRDAMLMSDAVRAAWLRWLEALIRRRTVLLVVEDLHWADPTSVRFLHDAARRFENAPLCVMATARSNVRERFPSLAGIESLQELTLEPLRRRPAVQLVRRLLGAHAPQDAVERIVERGGGNPFFLEQLARSWRPSAPGELPATVRAAIEGRIAPLDPYSRRVLRAASVFGTRFAADGVAAIVGADDEQRPRVQKAIEDLVRTWLIKHSVRGLDAGALDFEFAHALERDVAYEALTQADRRAAHRLAARWLQGAASNDAALIAEHYEQSDAPGEAPALYARAARGALQAQALERAVTLCERALPGAEDRSVRGELLAIQAEAEYWLGRLEEATNHGRAALDEIPGRGVDRFRVIASLITSLGQRGRNEDVERWLRELADSGAGDEEASLNDRVIALCRGAQQLSAAGRLEAAREALDAAEKVLRTRPGADQATKAHAAWARAGVHLAELDYEATILALRETLAAHRAIDNERAECLVLIHLGSLSFFVGALDEAAQLLDEAIAVARRLGVPYLQTWASYGRGKVLVESGAPGEARKALLAIAEDAVDSPRIAGGAWVYLALDAMRAGDAAQAERYARRATETHDAPAFRAAALAAWARALVGCDRPHDALVAAEEAWAILEREGSLSEFDGLVRLAYADALASNGRNTDAARAIDRAHAHLENIAKTLTDPGRRDAFLRGLHLHRETVARARVNSPGDP